MFTNYRRAFAPSAQNPPLLLPLEGSSASAVSARPRTRPIGASAGDRSWAVFGSEKLPTPCPARVLRIRDGLMCWVDVLPGRTKKSSLITRVFWCANLAWIGLRSDRDSLVPNLMWSSVLNYCTSVKPGGRRTEKSHISVSSIMRILPGDNGQGRIWDNQLGMGSFIPDPASWGAEVATLESRMRARGVDHPLNPALWERSLHSVGLQDVDASCVVMVSSEVPDQAAWAAALALQVISGDLPSLCDPVSGISPLTWTLRTWAANRAVLTGSSRLPKAAPTKIKKRGPTPLRGKRLNRTADEFPSLSCAAAILASADPSQPMDELPRSLVRMHADAIPEVLRVLADRVRLQKGPARSRARTPPPTSLPRRRSL